MYYVLFNYSKGQKEKDFRAGKRDLEDKKKDWELCSKCEVNKVAPWNKKGICSPCQQAKKSKRDRNGIV